MINFRSDRIIIKTLECVSITLLILLISNIFSLAQATQTKNPHPNKPEVKNDKINIQLTPFGYISLPKGYWAYMEADFMDAWAGVIETLDGDFKIRFSDGLIVSVFDREDKNIKWKKELKSEDNVITYALSDNGKTKWVLAKIKSANFSTQIQNDAEIEKFLEIISDYRLGKCETCFNSRTTKYLKKFFEKLNKND